MASESGSEDKRVVRTREALTQALMDLVAEVDYEQITVAEIIARASVGRSTFYQHYAGKDDILAAVMEGGFAALADTVDEGSQSRYLIDWLDIFWRNRTAGRVLLSGQTRRPILRELASRLEPKLDRRARAGSRVSPIAVKLAAPMIADAQLGLLYAWLSGRAPATSQAMAEALGLATQGLADGLFGPAQT